MKTKLIAWYLPQYHCIPENNVFWGEGFTDWVTVKKARPLFKGHQQPKTPLNNNYYDLSIKENVTWQAKLAKDYGIYGFGIYHYWFNNEKNLLTKPLEIIYNNKEIDIHYFMAWDNANWKRSWSAIEGNSWAPIADNDQKTSKESGILIPYILGNESDWKNHYNHLLPYFKDKRYIKVDNKPMFTILQYDESIEKMCRYWYTLAQEDGFCGIYFIFKNKRWFVWGDDAIRFNYEPHYNGWLNPTIWERKIEKIRKNLHLPIKNNYYSYDTIWRRIIKNAKETTKNEYLGAFVGYDDSPRRSIRGKIVKGASPYKFKKYLSQLLRISNNQGKEFIFITAWNEWGEGAFLEPDTINKYDYLAVIKELANKQ
jgi:lipopolysaccharide biosynthesis protein